METKKLSQKEYLKKYLKGSDDTKKKKKKKFKTGPKRINIIDDDVDLKNMRPIEDGEFAILNTTEDAPQIVGVIDERGSADFTNKKRWKVIADDGDGNVAITNDYDQRNFMKRQSSTITTDLLSKRPRELLEAIEKQKYTIEDPSPPHKSQKKLKKSSAYHEDVDSDLSPPRKNKKKSKRNNESDSDSSSPRQSRKQSYEASKNNSHYDSDFNLSRKSRQEFKASKNNRRSDSDLSPPRKSRKELKKFRNRQGSDSDQSPPRKSYKESSSKKSKYRQSNLRLSPPRKHQEESLRSSRNHKESDSDLSPPRKSRDGLLRTSRSNRGSDLDLSPPRASYKGSSKNSRNHRDSDSDLSPPRKSRDGSTKNSRNRRGSDSDLSPPRQPRQEVSRNNLVSDSDFSPPRRSHGESSKSSRNYRGSNAESYSPRNSRTSSKNSRYSERTSEQLRHDNRRSSEFRKPRWERDSRQSSPDNNKRLKKTLDGKSAGLQNAQALREETIAHKKREWELFKMMDAEVSGVGKAAVLRDRKTGKRRNLEAEAAEREEKEKKQKEVEEKYTRWGKGLKQVDDQAQKLKDDLYEMSKPLARYADDADLDARLRAVEREGDPMLDYIKQKQIKEGKRKPDEPRYQGSFMPNRFGIEPGPLWDGVDRSNGYEKKWFEAKNAKSAIQEEAYKWSTADM